MNTSYLILVPLNIRMCQVSKLHALKSFAVSETGGILTEKPSVKADMSTALPGSRVPMKP